MSPMESSKGEPIPQLLRGRKSAVLVGDYFHIHEAYYPYFRLRESGVDVVFVGERENEVYHDYNGEPLRSDISVEEALNRRFDLIHCPGGFMPMKLRGNNDMIQLARNHFHSGRLFSAICHAGSFLVTMGILKGRKATCYHTLKDDLINAGADYIDNAPIVDGNLITARTPDDLPNFMETIIQYLEKGPDNASRLKGPRTLEGKRIAILVENRYQAHQVWFFYYRFKAKGGLVEFIGDSQYEIVHSRVSRVELKSDLSAREVMDARYDVIIVTGDWAADKIRINSSFLNFVKRHVSNGALIVSVAEGHSILVSAGLLKGKEVAGPPEMKQDLENCGATVIDGPAWNDGPFITCRSTEDLPDIMRRILSYM